MVGAGIAWSRMIATLLGSAIRFGISAEAEKTRSIWIILSTSQTTMSPGRTEEFPLCRARIFSAIVMPIGVSPIFSSRANPTEPNDYRRKPAQPPTWSFLILLAQRIHRLHPEQIDNFAKGAALTA